MGGALTYITNILKEITHVADNNRFVVVVPSDTLEVLKDVVKRFEKLVGFPIL